jgi:hypothetical protein
MGLCILIHCGSAQGLSDTSIVLAEKIISYSHVEAQYTAMFLSLKDKLSFATSESPEALSFMNRLWTETFAWDGMSREWASLYAQEFNEGELKEIDSFFHSFVGQKYAQRFPLLYQRYLELLQKRIDAVPEYLEKESKYLHLPDQLEVPRDSLLDCKLIRNGVYMLRVNAGHYYCIIRNDTSQTEVFPKTGQRHSFAIAWRTRDSYDLIYKGSNKGNYLGLTVGEPVHVKVTSVNNEGYDCYVTMKNKTSFARLLRIQ